MTELVIGSAAFLVILTSAIMMLTQWMKLTGESDRAIEATDRGARAIGQIASDIRMATYLYHYATVSITGDKFANFGVKTMPVVTQSDNDADLQGRNKAYFAARGGSQLMGEKSPGSTNVLAMISDQPDGISRPRYIVYWLDDSAAEKAKNQIIRYRTDGGEEIYYLLPLYRLEASPSASNVDATPKGWYTFADKLSASGTSSLYIKVPEKKLAEAPFPAPKELDVNVRVSKVADVVMGPGISNLFTLRNPHPYSNASLMSPYLATVSIRTTGVKVGAFLKRRAELFELNTQAFARNIPLPQTEAK
ncbi:hypothetical protein D3C86_1037060 [compost metagenome]